MVKAAFGRLPGTNIAEDDDESDIDLSIYLPVAVFGYLAYLDGFETVLIPFLIPIWDGFRPIVLVNEYLLPVTYLRATVYMVAAFLFAVHLGDRSGGAIGDPRWYDKLCMLVVGLTFVLAPIASLWVIHGTELYAVSLIGLVLSFAQFLYVVNPIIKVLVEIVYIGLIDVDSLIR